MKDWNSKLCYSPRAIDFERLQSNAVKCIYVECDLEDAGPTIIVRNLDQERNGVGSGPMALLAWDWHRRQKSQYHIHSVRKGSFE